MERGRTYLIAAALPVATAVWAYVYWRRSDPPRISLATTEVEFPVCRYGKSYPFAVFISNEGPKPLRLEIVEVECSGAEASLGKDVLAGGESSVLNGTITPRNPVGPFSGRIVVASNDPDARRTVVTLRGNVRPYLEHSPAGVSLRPNMHERGKVPLHVWNTDDRPISFSAHVIGVDAVLEPGRMTLQPQETGVVDISCPATVLQHQANRICLYTDHPEQRTVVIPISVEPVRGLMARPAEIRLGFVTRDEIPKQRYTLMIEGTLAPSARITDIVVPQFLTVASQKEDPATGVKEVAFAFSDADVHGVPEGEIAIHVALKDQPINETTVVVPVSGIVQ